MYLHEDKEMQEIEKTFKEKVLPFLVGKGNEVEKIIH